jgi:hypothetical protein
MFAVLTYEGVEEAVMSKIFAKRNITNLKEGTRDTLCNNVPHKNFLW